MMVSEVSTVSFVSATTANGVDDNECISIQC